MMPNPADIVRKQVADFKAEQAASEAEWKKNQARNENQPSPPQ
jgi:hypothetical protein